MVQFMIYLLETGICLSLLYLAWWLFLRKETYFSFNRLYLVGSIVLALVIPLLHLNLDIPLGSALENPARGISSFRSGYENLIGMIDADFGKEPGQEHARYTENWSPNGSGGGEHGILPNEGAHGDQLAHEEAGEVDDSERASGLISRILLILYISGVVYFLARFIYLLVRLRMLTRHNRVSRQQEFRMVEIGEQISPFSFFRFLFVNSGFFDESELMQVLEHEKAHIRERHSMDHLFAHGFAVFQWFNPLAWQVRKALKTTHEYIADRHVLMKGIERNDYQALLLKQVIGYHSVELVNNFNLKPIKKRIAMMNRNKSGFPAKLRAALVIPVSILLFFLFAEFTMKGSDTGMNDVGPDLSGLWISQTADEFSQTLLIQGNTFSYTEGIQVRDFHLEFDKGQLLLSRSAGQQAVSLKYEQSGSSLILWWNDARSTTYERSEAENTLDQFLISHDLKADLPYISRYRLMENEEMIYRISINQSTDGLPIIAYNGKKIGLDELSSLVSKEKDELAKTDQGSLTALFLIDRSIPMEQVGQVREELRKMGSLHIAEGGYPHGELDLSPLLYHAVGLPRLLPPPEAKVLDKKELEKMGGQVHIIDLTQRNKTPGDVDKGLRAFIRSSKDGRYVISLEYDGAIPYGQYVETVDMIWNVVYSFRDDLALSKYNLPYEKLGADLQRQIRKAYPMALSEFSK